MRGDVRDELEGLRDELARLRLAVEQHHREVMEALGLGPAPADRGPAPPPPYVPPRYPRRPAVEAHVAEWARALVRGDRGRVEYLERLMEGGEH